MHAGSDLHRRNAYPSLDKHHVYLYNTNNIKMKNFKQNLIDDINQDTKTTQNTVWLIWFMILWAFLSGIGVTKAGYDLQFNLNPPADHNWNLVDLDKLAWAVGMHETKYCTSPGSPTANKRNNCWGIMTWEKGYRELKTYSTTDEGKEDFKRIWSSFYGGLPTYQDAKRYSGEDKAEAWYYNVLWAYNNN